MTLYQAFWYMAYRIDYLQPVGMPLYYHKYIHMWG